MFKQIGVNIKHLRKEKKLSQSELAEKLSMTRQQVANYEKGETTIPFISLFKMSEIFNISIDSLVSNSLQKKIAGNTAGNTAGNNKNFEYNLEVTLPTEISANEEITKYPSRTDHYMQEQRIPLYDMEAAAGMLPMLQDLDSKEPLDYLYIPNAPACDGAIFATGDSMYPLLKSGDILAFKIINDIRNNVFWGEMYILYIDVEDDLFRVVKYVQKGKDELHYLLVSQNKHHQDKEVRIDKIKAMAQVKLSIRMN